MLKLSPLVAHVASELLDGSGVEGATESVMRDVRVEASEEDGVIVEAELAECVEVRADVKGEVMNGVTPEVNVEAVAVVAAVGIVGAVGVEVRADVAAEVINDVATEVNVELRVGGSVVGIALLSVNGGRAVNIGGIGISYTEGIEGTAGNTLEPKATRLPTLNSISPAPLTCVCSAFKILCR